MEAVMNKTHSKKLHELRIASEDNVEATKSYALYLLDLYDLYEKKGDSDSVSYLSDDLAYVFVDGANRDTIALLGITDLFRLSNSGVYISTITCSYEHIHSNLKKEPQNYELACVYADNLSIKILQTIMSGSQKSSTLKAMEFMKNELAQLADDYPDIPIIVMQYAESLYNVGTYYQKKAKEKHYRDALKKLSHKYPKDEEIQRLLQRLYKAHGYVPD
jgi:hypothetical protein